MKTEHEILEMAFDMFLEKGFSEVSTNEIIREAGLTKGGFYYYFKSREDLDQRVVERFIHPFFTKPVEKMQEVWNGKKQDIPTGELLWHGFFMPQRFVNFQKAVDKDVAFRNFYFLLYESMKKFPEVNDYFKGFNIKRGEMLTPKEIGNLLHLGVMGVVPEDDHVTIFGQLGKVPDFAISERSGDILAENVVKSTKNLVEPYMKKRWKWR